MTAPARTASATFVLRILRRLLDGEVLRAAELVGPDGRQAVQRQRLQLLAKHLPWVHRDGAGRGVPQTFRWEWPDQRRSRPEQVWALAAARTLLQVFRDAEVGGVLTTQLEDHLRRLPGGSEARDDMERMFFALSRMLEPLDVGPDTVDRLSQAILRRRQVRASYVQFDGSQLDVLMEPWTLVFADEGPYLYGRIVESDKEDHVDRKRVLNVARIQHVKETSNVFAYPVLAEHDPKEVFRHCFGVMVPAHGAQPEDVELRFAPSMSAYLSHHRLHRSQLERAQDASGHTIVRARLFVTYDLVRWVRGHGTTVEVLSPASLRNWVESGRGGEGFWEFVTENP